MSDNEIKRLPFEVCATQSLMAQTVALTEARKIKSALDKIGEKRLIKMHPFRHGIALTINGLESRISNLYQTNARYNNNAAKDIAIVKSLLADITNDLQPEIDRLKRCIFKYASFNDCIYEDLIALFMVIGTMLHHAVEVFDLVDNPYRYLREGFDVYRTKERIRPEREYKNFVDAVTATKIVPSDLNFFDDMDVHNCVVIIADKMGKAFVEKFTQPIAVL